MHAYAVHICRQHLPVCTRAPSGMHMRSPAHAGQLAQAPHRMCCATALSLAAPQQCLTPAPAKTSKIVQLPKFRQVALVPSQTACKEASVKIYLSAQIIIASTRRTLHSFQSASVYPEQNTAFSS